MVRVNEYKPDVGNIHAGQNFPQIVSLTEFVKCISDRKVVSA